MPQFDDNHVKLTNGLIVWDGITQPEQVDTPQGKGLKWTLKAVFEPTNPDLQLFSNLAMKALQESKWRGQLPAGGVMPIRQLGPMEYNGQFNGFYAISFKTWKVPQVFDENGAILDAMQYAQVIYTGQRVDILAHCKEYEHSGNKGIGARLDGFAVLVSKQAPRQNFGGGVNAAAAFGGGQQPTAQVQGFQQEVQGFQQHPTAQVQGFQQHPTAQVQGFQQEVQGFQQEVQGFQQHPTAQVQGFQQEVQGFQQQPTAQVQGFQQEGPHATTYPSSPQQQNYLPQ